jgi:peptidyl-prolyl cis-trans isomerase C
VDVIVGKNKYGKGYEKKLAGGNIKSNKGSPLKGGKIKASHILVEKYTKAKEIYDRLISGENFETFAREYSTCSSKNRGGNLGQFTKGDMVPEFWNACVSLRIGEISEPVKSQFGYHIIKRTG